ncbi:MAG: hypothetical protein HGA96_16645, partial [Desulfobulbaceae bacterium]|nr:hypothetical protein [Desulfobulbaceae bacterium]
SKRVYKEALGVEAAVAILKEERGQQFDPQLLDLFIGRLAAMVAIRDKFADAPGG